MILCHWKSALSKRHHKPSQRKKEKLQLKNNKVERIALIFTDLRRKERASSGEAICKQLIAALKKCPSILGCLSIESFSTASTDAVRTLKSWEIALSRLAESISMPISRRMQLNWTLEAGQVVSIMKVICGKVQKSPSPRCFLQTLIQKPKEDIL